MIKRRFYRLEHGDRDDASASSSSSESELEAEATGESEDDAEAEIKEDEESCSTSSGYKSEDSSVHEIDVNSCDVSADEDDNERENKGQHLIDSHLSDVSNAEIQTQQPNTITEKDSLPADIPACVLKCKSVFKCRLCPRIVCLTEETLRAHLKSKRHARSEKLLNEGRLKAVLNSDGEIENQDIPVEIDAQTVAASEDKPKRKSRGRRGRRQQNKRKKKMKRDSDVRKTAQSNEVPLKKRQKRDL